MKREWILPEKSYNKDILQALIKKRGIIGRKAVDEFLSVKPQLTYDPFLMKDMEQGADRILSAIAKGEHICIYGDYDADGVCAISLLMEILGKLSAKVSYYIPSRFDEGYGLNKEALEAISNKGVDLIVTVDCGSVSFDEVDYAKEIGLELIVTDHHNLNDRAASCLLINPNQQDCLYPEHVLSGCGVAFKLAQALQRKTVFTAPSLTKADLNEVLDLVAIATIGDIVPLIGENRTLTKYGLKVINSGSRPGLAILIEGTGLKAGDINAENIAYVIVPHLNAAGRMLTAETGVTLLTSREIGDLKEAASLLIANNSERRRIQEKCYEETVLIVEKHHREDLFLIVNTPDVHEGIAGIVAGKIKEKYHRPAILVTPTGKDLMKGTGRSIEGINLYEMLSACHHLFEKFGGHAGACGFLIKEEKLPALREALRASAESLYQSNPLIFQPRLYIDLEVTPNQLAPELVRALEELEPYGHKNPKPLFYLHRLYLGSPSYMGEKQQHVRFFADRLACVFFNRADELREYFNHGTVVDLVGYAEINRWNGNEKIQFVVIDIRCYNENDL
jgi:single-stranded-DNA-specific exonuclease